MLDSNSVAEEHPSAEDHLVLGRLFVRRLEESEFDGIAEAWNQLLSASAADNFFLRWEWIHTWWEIFQDGRELWILAAFQGKELIGLAPFYLEKSIVFGVRELRFCTASDLYPDYLDVIAKAGLESAVANAFFEYIAGACRTNVVIMDNLLPDSALFRHLDLADPWFSAVTRPSNLCPFIRIEGSFDDYLQTRFSAKSRRQLLRKHRQMMESQGMHLTRVERPEELSEAIDGLLELHLKRAETKSIQSSLAMERKKVFYQKISSRILGQGLLDLYLLWDGQEPVGAKYNFRYHGKAYSYQGGFAPHLKKYSPGSVMLMELIRCAHEDGLQEYDFLMGGEEYKQSWATDARQEYEVRLFRRNVVGQTLKLWHRARRTAAFMARSVRKQARCFP